MYDDTPTWVLLDSALEHAAHGWQKLVEAGLVTPHDEGWPPNIDDTVMASAPYHFAVMISYVKAAYHRMAPADE